MEERIQFLRKKADRKRKLPEFLNELAKISNRCFDETEVLSVEQTEILKSEISKRNFYQSVLVIAKPTGESNYIKQILTALKPCLLEMSAYFSTNRYLDSFYLLTDASFVIDTFEKIIDFDGDTLFVYDITLKNGFLIDLNEESWAIGERIEKLLTYELRVWGTEWIMKVSTQLS
ncbi:hypothetical protein TH63_11030 [Rufibacter radiotolerans]|uniref:Uncharacterized protein n=1 Tax=Rufibacter radiotolerans TaxID=1379910 RepID=A0A0H4VL30_9BACT|nr:hypothetical protein [Rufibacter radiotolerans]AKQ46053.1 hypothetical protein TH63_11030 [Rufibacter radiotolerans]